IDAVRDVILTGAGADDIDTALASSTVAGGNIILSGSGDDAIAIGRRDRVFAGRGDDIITAFESQGGNRASGGAGRDTFFTGDTNGLGDRFLGGTGEDTFFVGAGGGNLFSGGADADTFVVVTGDNPGSANTISDFTSGEDVLEIAASALGAGDLDLTDGSNVILGGDTIAVLIGVLAADLTVGSDIVFV
ncbi:hypothetical protein KR51_00022210, partial [Rubidibacter lacunae KORDI 51-2]